MMPEKAGKWTKEDDQRLVEVIERNTINGQINWSNVMIHFPQKPRTTLQSRYTYSLNPRINRSMYYTIVFVLYLIQIKLKLYLFPYYIEPFTPEEDLLLLAAVKEYGTKFSYIPRTLFPNRTSVQLRTRYRNTLVHRHKQKSWSLEDDAKLMDCVTKYGTKSWKKCEEVVMNHSRISCRTRFLVISKFFEQNPGATLADIKRKKMKQWNYVNTENWTEKLDELRDNPKAPLVKRIFRKPVRKPRIKKQIKKEDEVKKVPKRLGRPKLPRERRAPRRKVDRKKKVYIKRLRTNGLNLYNSVKYAYDYQLGVDPATTNNAKYTKLPFVRSALKLQEREDGKNHRYDDNVPASLRTKITKSLRSKRGQEIDIPVGFSLPTSWSTAVAFRALCIHTARSDIESVEAPTFENSNDHINLFRERMRTLFYTTALLSRLHPQMVGIGVPPEALPPPEPVVPEETENTSEKRKSNDGDDDNKPKRQKVVKSVVDQVILSIKREFDST